MVFNLLRKVASEFWQPNLKDQISFEPGLGAYQGLAQKMKVAFSRIVASLCRSEGSRAKPNPAPNPGTHQRKALRINSLALANDFANEMATFRSRCGNSLRIDVCDTIQIC